MNNNIQIFNDERFGQIRTQYFEKQAWFVGKDVATALGYKDPSRAVYDRVQACDKTSLLIQQSGSNYKANTLFINESGVYSLILSSKLPQAQEFKHWITSEVLPQIRETGGYIPVQDGDDEKLILCRALEILKRTVDRQALKLSDQQEKLEKKELQLKEQAPEVEFAQAVSSSESSILIRDLAKLITQNGVKIGQGRLFYWLRLHGYLFQHETRPIQEWVEKGIFDTQVTMIHTHHGHRSASPPRSRARDSAIS